MSVNRVSCIIGTAGHIDHGKTSLIKALTGMDTDRLKEEKRRGLSIDLGFAYMEFKTGSEVVRAGIVDVPGHERFIRNMLAGITGIDLVLFVVAADDGVMPQTLEHLDIVRLLGIEKGVFAVTKCDLAEEERLLDVEGEIKALIRDTALMGAPLVRVSSITGEGLDELKGLLFERLRGRGADPRGFFRLPVDRSFAIKGFGTVVTGTVASGSVKKGDEVTCLPGGARLKVRGLESLMMGVEEVSAGERAAVNVSGISHREIRRGFVLASPVLSGFVDGAPGVDCFLEFLANRPGLETFKPVKNSSLLKLHHHTGETLVKVRLAGKKAAGPGERVFARVKAKNPLLMLRGDRFILRNPAVNTTIGGGVVYVTYPTKASMPALKNFTPPEKFETPGETLKRVLPERGLGFDRRTLSLMLNIREEFLPGVLGDAEGFRGLGGFIVSTDRLEEAGERTAALLDGFHKTNPAEEGMREEEVFNAVKDDVSSGLGVERASLLFKEIVDDLVAGRRIKRHGPLLSLFSHTPASAGVDAGIEGELSRLFSSGGLSARRMEEITVPPHGKDDIKRVMEYLMRKGAVVRLKTDSFISGGAIDEAKRRLVEHINNKGAIKASEFRDILGCGRKLAIEILEYFDRERVTLRKGDVRTLR